MYVFAAILIVVLAFLLAPGIGGHLTRRRWRRFRETVVISAQSPEVSFTSGRFQGQLGLHRFQGHIEALSGKDSVWIRGEDASVLVRISDADIYILPVDINSPPDNRTLRDGRLPDECPKRVSWKSFTSLQEGTAAYLCGFLENREGILEMFGTQENPLLVILHDGTDVIPRAVWTGRQLNEYCNPLTPWALVASSMTLFVMASALFGTQRDSVTAQMILLAALFPVMPFLPPGMVFLILYLGNWRRVRFLRAKQDLLRLSALLRKGEGPEALWAQKLPVQSEAQARSHLRLTLALEVGAVGAFMVGFAANVFLASLILKAVI